MQYFFLSLRLLFNYDEYLTHYYFHVNSRGNNKKWGLLLIINMFYTNIYQLTQFVFIAFWYFEASLIDNIHISLDPHPPPLLFFIKKNNGGGVRIRNESSQKCVVNTLYQSLAETCFQPNQSLQETGNKPPG